jgi:hypothetical protein
MLLVCALYQGRLCKKSHIIQKNINVLSVFKTIFMNPGRLVTEFHDLFCNYVGSASPPLFRGRFEIHESSQFNKKNKHKTVNYYFQAI